MDTLTIRFSLGGSEDEALKRLAYQEPRTPREQARHLLREELVERGLLRERDEVTQKEEEEASDGI